MCLAKMDDCFGCDNKDQKMRDRPNLKAKRKKVEQDPNGCPDPNPPRKKLLLCNKD